MESAITTMITNFIEMVRCLYITRFKNFAEFQIVNILIGLITLKGNNGNGETKVKVIK